MPGPEHGKHLRVTQWAVAVIAVATAAVVIPLSLLPGPTAGSGPRALAGTATVPAAITVDPLAGGTFAPALASAPRLTAQQALARFNRYSGGAAVGIPSRPNVRLGLLTLPVSRLQANGAAYIALNELVYGYSAPASCTAVFAQTPIPPPPHARCFSWTFADANTGRKIISTYQESGSA